MDAIGQLLSPILVGRDEILDLAGQRMTEVAAGRGWTLLLAGEAGLGKTRLVGAIRRRAEAIGFSAVGGDLAPQDQQVPGASILDLARSMTRTSRFAAVGASVLQLRDDAVSAAKVGRRLLVGDIVDRIIASVDEPTLLVFDDLQWADELSLETIGELARAGRERPLLLIGAYRTEDAPPGTSLRGWRSRLLTQRIAEEVPLERLTRDQTATVTTLLLASGLPAPREVVDAVYERTDGVPLHVEELLAALGGEARRDVDAIRAAHVPDTIEEAVLARLSRRSPEAQAIARAGAVIGRCFVSDVLAGMMDLPADDLEGPLQELVDHAILYPPGPRGLFDFRHQLLRDVLYGSVPARDRRRFHALAGEFGATLEGASEIHASLHYERAGLRDQAYASAVAGARQATRLSAHREAFELYRRAVDNTPDDLSVRERGALLAAYASEAGAIEENDEAQRAGHEAESLLRASGAILEALQARLDMVAAWRRNGEPVSVRGSAIDAMLAELQGLPANPAQQRLRTVMLAVAAIVHIDAFDLERARTVLGDARSSALALGDQEVINLTDWLLARCAVVAGDTEAGLAAMSRIADAMVRSGDVDGVSAYRDGTELALRYLDYGAAERFGVEGLRYADTIQQSHCAHVMNAGQAMLAWAIGDWDRAAIAGQHAVVDRGCGRAATMARWAIGYTALGRGDLERADAVLTEALAFAERAEAVDLILPAAWGLAETALLAGHGAEAAERCESALLLADVVGQPLLVVTFVVTGVRAYQAAGRPDEAARWLERCETRLGHGGGLAAMALAHGRGLIALGGGSVGVARRELESALRGWSEHRRAWEASWCRLDLAACLVRSSRFAAAVAVASEVREAASRLGSPSLLARADELVRLARGHVAEDEPWRPLTVREFEVARLVGQGRTNPEIADTLGIAPKTASAHVEHILAKLGASRRAEIATWASQIEGSAASH